MCVCYVFHRERMVHFVRRPPQAQAVFRHQYRRAKAGRICRDRRIIHRRRRNRNRFMRSSACVQRVNERRQVRRRVSIQHRCKRVRIIREEFDTNADTLFVQLFLHSVQEEKLRNGRCIFRALRTFTASRVVFNHEVDNLHGRNSRFLILDNLYNLIYHRPERRRVAVTRVAKLILRIAIGVGNQRSTRRRKRRRCRYGPFGYVTHIVARRAGNAKVVRRVMHFYKVRISRTRRKAEVILLNSRKTRIVCGITMFKRKLRRVVANQRCVDFRYTVKHDRFGVVCKIGELFPTVQTTAEFFRCKHQAFFRF